MKGIPVTSAPIRVLLIDDHTLFRSGVRALLARQADIEVVGEAENGHEGIKLATALRPDVVLLDLNMPGLSGVETLHLLLQDCAGLAVVMLTVSEDASDLTQALRAGARGYLLKNINAEFLIQAIGRAAAGESVMSEAMTAKLMEQFRLGGSPAVALPCKQDDVSQPLKLLARAIAFTDPLTGLRRGVGRRLEVVREDRVLVLDGGQGGADLGRVRVGAVRLRRRVLRGPRRGERVCGVQIDGYNELFGRRNAGILLRLFAALKQPEHVSYPLRL